MKKGPLFSLHEFKDWMSHQKDSSSSIKKTQKADPPHEYVGEEVYAKVSKHKISQRMETKGNRECMLEEFLDEGGIVTNVVGKMIVVEVSCGTFNIPRFCVKIKKTK